MGTDPYTGREDVKVLLGIAAGVDAVLDPLLDALILQVSSAFDSHIFGTSAPRDQGLVITQVATEYHDGGMTTVIPNYLMAESETRRAPATTEIVVSEDGVELVAGVDWHIDDFPSNIIHRTSEAEVFGRRFAAGHRNIKVVYPPAYEFVPHDIARAANEECARAYKGWNTDSGDGGALGITQRTPDAGTTLTYTVDDVSAMTLRVLESYKKQRAFL